jgi:hypothetical protein
LEKVFTVLQMKRSCLEIERVARRKALLVSGARLMSRERDRCAEMLLLSGLLDCISVSGNPVDGRLDLGIE